MRIADGQMVEANGREEAWIAERIANRHTDQRSFERTLLDGRILRVVEQILPNGELMEIHSDISKQFLAEQKLQQSDRRRGDLHLGMECHHPANTASTNIGRALLGLPAGRTQSSHV